LQRDYSEDHADDVRFITTAIGLEKVLRRKSGRGLAYPWQGFYTKKVFKEVTGLSVMGPKVKEFAEERWVWGAGGVSATVLMDLTSQVTDLYERDYSKEWDALLNDLEIRPFETVPQYVEALKILTEPNSPLRGILKTVDENTSIVAPPSESASRSDASSVGTRMVEGARQLFSATQKKLTGAAAGAMITDHFEKIHRFMGGAPAPIDGILGEIGKIRDQLLKLGPQVLGESPLKALSDPELINLQRTLRENAKDPPVPSPIDRLVREIAQYTGKTVSVDATRELEKLYREEVVDKCRSRVDGRYPFGSMGDMPLSEFGEVFGYGGLYDKFFTDRLDSLVDKSQRSWVWREGSVDPSVGILAQFQRADHIREMFFGSSPKAPKLEFNVKLSNLDSGATRLYFKIDGQPLDLKKPGLESRGAFMWPIPEKSGAVAQFEDSVATAEDAQATPISGPWALFRLIDVTSEQARPGTGPYSVLGLRTEHGHHSAVVTIEASDATRNPFTNRDWRQFKCGS
jgi:type VI secretion system protein ImpL